VDVIVQRVKVTWTKRSRGRPGAALRHAVPVAFPLPSGRPPRFHDIVADEDDGFVPRLTVHDGGPPARVFGLRPAGDTLQVRLPNGFGVPVRRHRPTVTLQRGEWVRWQLNNRSSSSTGMAGWYYSQTTVSVAFGPVPVDAFLGTAPHVVDELAALW
jgi:hypothetical protein